MGNEYSQELIDLSFAALDHGVSSVRDSGGPLIPFVMSESGWDRRLDRFASELLEEALAQGIAHVQAVRSQPMGLAQRYRPKKALRRFEALGNPMLLPPGSSKLDL